MKINLMYKIFIIAAVVFILPYAVFSEEDTKQIILNKSRIRGEAGKPMEIPLIKKKRYKFKKSNNDSDIKINRSLKKEQGQKHNLSLKHEEKK